MKALIVTADDFGLSLPVNEAVEEAHRFGTLSAASLMVGAPAASDAVARAQRLPSLGVGLHLTLLDGRPVLPAWEIPGLTGSDGRFFTDPVRFGVALFFSAELRRQARAEIAAQFRRFGDTGLSMDHVNGHKHFHLHPVVAQAIAELAPAYGNPPVRVPWEPYGPSFRAMGDGRLRRMLTSTFYGAQRRAMRARLSAAGLPVTDAVFGLNDSGAMTEARVLGILDHLPEAVSEIYCHPATGRWDSLDNLPASYRPEEEFAALVSPVVRARMEALGLRPLTYRAALSASQQAAR